ncbi:glycosyltransferase involved in cell wall biosynthesis [Dysgonomonas alginatilytica]|uniref:Glycosyltransferase involved in cell wall biosynthesis n=1 Tax=Dysgonomonas alginatilytica TaxID=1605892 RepID=A0A2V3PNP7_9BACT|nr:glycosyltransferase family A protein [Dysgonomonas alginatilytica]PXV64128.1 glycosyltransferase involved in cell wall biosynthesis [Dysgonomonas alginatilytica]
MPKISPVISIIVPCYNQAEYLPETLQTVLEQEYIDWECIIVNDGSPDNTEEVALAWCRKDDRFKYLKKENGGLSDARNYGIKHSTGKYILPLDSDDKISKDYTIEAIGILEKDPSVKLVFCRAKLFGVQNEEWDLLPYTYDNMLFVRNCIYCSAIYKRSDYDLTAGYNVNMIYGWEDYDFWLSLLRREDKVVKLDKFHFFYRTKDVSMRTLINEEKERFLRLQIFKNHMDIYLEYINPIEMYSELKRYKLIENSLQYRIGGIILAPLRYIHQLLKKK